MSGGYGWLLNAAPESGAINGGKNSGIQLKGANFGIRVVFPDGPGVTDEALLKMFASVPEAAYAMPIGRGIVLDFQSRPCSENIITGILREVIWPRKLSVLAWLTSDAASSGRLKDAGFQVTEPVFERTAPPAPPASPAPNAAKKLILNHSLRAGSQEEHGGDVVLAGHLHEGAELYAGGSVFVLGRLKGLVHAGCGGTEGVCVAAASFEARQLRIGDKLCDQFATDMKWWKKPVIITLEEDGLLFREWTCA